MSRNLVEEDLRRPRIAPRQLLRENHPAETTEKYYRASVAVPFLDNMRNQLEERFKHSDLAKDRLLLVPASIIKQFPNGCHAVPNGVKCLAVLWEKDLKKSTNADTEFVRWVDKWNRANTVVDPTTKQKPVIPTSLTEALKVCDKDFHPNLHQMLILMCTLPITTAECERSMSRLRILKTYLRSTMGAERFNGLALMQIHKDSFPVDVGAVVETFAVRYRTHMALLPETLLNN